MVHVSDALRVLIPVLYALAATNSVVLFVTRADFCRRASKPLLGTTVLLHAFALGLAAVLARRCPLGTVFETTGLMAFSLAAVYTYLEFRSGTRPTGILILPLAFLLELLAAAFPVPAVEPNPALKSPWFSLHAASAVLGVAALAVSFVHGVFYLLLYRRIRAKRFGILFRRLPPLAVLNRMTHMATVVGWVLLFVTIVAGYVWAAKEESLERLARDPLFFVTLGVFLLYSAALGIRFVAGWRGRYTVYVSVCGFAVLLVCLICVSFLLPSLHEFR